MLHSDLIYCPLSELFKVIQYQDVIDNGSYLEVRFSFPKILFWRGDQFCYAEAARISDVVIADNRSQANDLAEKRVEAIFNWEHRKAYDGITAVLPALDG
ncbi:hypothetical protein [Endozoicomonas ascidiicola]|uniref:hypothetical protein n=1 Tax=Endozoicomonas ascidiicola TaxID=1698521 RepID=UPI0008364591|nr:hypothetical protein [Endozoicomonas ascidiicola]